MGSASQCARTALQEMKGAGPIALGRQVQHQIGIGLLHRYRGGLSVGEIHPDGLLRVDGAFRDLGTWPPWWRLGFTAKPCWKPSSAALLA